VIKVVVVDDSAIMRKIIVKMLEKDSSVNVVGVASNGGEALEKIEALKPDVVTMDIDMPGMDGIEALRRIMATNPIPVIMVSALTEEGAQITLEALEIGAADFITKNTPGGAIGIFDKENELLSKVKQVAQTKARPVVSTRGAENLRSLVSRTSRASQYAIVAIGASTGGPLALQKILPRLPKDFPLPLVIAQHMPKLFTLPFAQRLSSQSQIEVKEAEDREALRSGVALIVPGDTHVRLTKKGHGVVVEFVSDISYRYRPSVDLLMQSTARIYENRSIGVILSGMGNDGFLGLQEIKAKRGFIIAQDEATCVVYGMPRAVITAKIADLVLPLDGIADELVKIL
jgi:two-component system chemotaxis response regulator CheB